MIVIDVAVQPIPQPRQRAGNRRLYVPEKHPVHAYKAAVRAAACRVMAGRGPIPAGVAVSAEFTFVLSRPAGRRRTAAASPCATACDGDNLQKAAQDALIGIVLADDRQIARWSGVKQFAPSGAGPSVRIVVRW